MKCFVTGASGFIGSNLVHELLRQGHEVRALVRPRADTRGLNGAGCERVTGDVLEPAALEPAMRGCDWCFHVAAQYALWVRDSLSMYASNVDGTRNVLQAATRAGCRRIVYTSTVGCIGLPHANGGEIRPSDETVAATPGEMTCHYKRSKWRAESVAAELATQGAPIVIVNPSAPLGPRDAKPTPTGKVVLDFLNRRLPAYVDTGLNWVHVRDVAVGHILAAERGRLGERYILGNANGNWTMHQTLLALEEITGLAAPRVRMPYVAALAAAYVDEARARVTGAPPIAVLAGVRMAKDKMYYSPAKAIRELGLPQTPPRIGMVEAVEWFRSNGYVTG